MDSSPDVGAQDPAAIADIGRVRDYKIAAHSGLLSISAAVVGLLSYGCTLLLANMLSAGEYSQFAAAQMLLGIVGIVASALVPLPLSHIVATHAQGSTGRREGIAFAFFVSVIAGTLSAILASGVTLAFAGPAMAGAVAFAAMLLFTVAAPAGWLQGELHFMRYAVISIGEVAVRFLFSFCVAVFSWGAVGGILGFAVGALVLFAIPLGFYRDVKWSPQVLHHRWRWTETGDIALTLCVVSVLVGADVVIVAFLDRGSPATAGFQALSTIAKGPVYVAAGTALVAFPLLRAPRIPDSEVLRSALRSFVQLAGVAFVVISTAPHSLVGIIFPARYHDSLDLLPWLGLAGIGYAALTVFATVLLALKAYSRCKWGLVVASTLMTGGILLGWQLADVSGIAVGCAIGSVLAGSVLATMMSPFLPVGEGMAALKGAVLIVSIGSVLAFASLWPLLWSVLAAGLGLGVLLYQRGNISGHQSLVSYGRRLASSFQATRGPAGFPTPRLTAGWKTGSWLGPAASSRASRAIDAKCEGARRVPAFGVEHRPTMSAAVMLRPMNKTTSLALFLAIAGVAFAIRGVGLTRSFELWADEMLYASLGLSVSNGQLPNLPDGPFFLHPQDSSCWRVPLIGCLGSQGLQSTW
ncbi:lipopolysaccharide biosynthesis protein [Pseudarthrobacter sp. L19]|uniref:lipopolysaccharide biosynthesis protein n=1 Tax=Pseudarthrobacter sp. L19 TaxID=3423951 RepID=UPI003D7C0AB2